MVQKTDFWAFNHFDRVYYLSDEAHDACLRIKIIDCTGCPLAISMSGNLLSTDLDLDNCVCLVRIW